MSKALPVDYAPGITERYLDTESNARRWVVELYGVWNHGEAPSWHEHYRGWSAWEMCVAVWEARKAHRRIRIEYRPLAAPAAAGRRVVIVDDERNRKESQ